LRRLASAEVAKGPGGISEHADLVIFTQEAQERTKSALLKNIVAALWAITRDVTQSPNGLLPDIQDGRRKQLDEFRDSLGVDDNLSVLSSTRGDVGECPGSLELITR
jgi:hypothetical protein